MARQPMVTRTMASTLVTTLAVDTVTGEAFNKTVELPRTYKDKEVLLKKVQKMFDTPTEKNVSIVDTKEQAFLYKMPEAQFISLAEKCDIEPADAVEE